MKLPTIINFFNGFEFFSIRSAVSLDSAWSFRRFQMNSRQIGGDCVASLVQAPRRLHEDSANPRKLRYEP